MWLLLKNLDVNKNEGVWIIISMTPSLPPMTLFLLQPSDLASLISLWCLYPACHTGQRSWNHQVTSVDPVQWAQGSQGAPFFMRFLCSGAGGVEFLPLLPSLRQGITWLCPAGKQAPLQISLLMEINCKEHMLIKARMQIKKIGSNLW